MTILKKIIENQDKYVRYLLIVPIVIYFIFGSFHISQFMTADEHFWFYKRIPQYWDAISTQQWKQTHINDKPGISLALISGSGLLWEKNPEQYNISDFENANPAKPQAYERLGNIFRYPVLIFNGLFSLFFFWVLKKITRKPWLALLGATGILLSPTLLGISQIANPDSFLWTFGSATVLSFVAFLFTQEKKFVLLVPFFFAMALLSKYSATILYPFLFVLIVIRLTAKSENLSPITPSLTKKYLLGYLLSIAGSLAFFSLFMPAVFVKPEYLIEGTIGYPGLLPIMLTIALLVILLFSDAHFLKGRILNWINEKLSHHRTLAVKMVYAFLLIVVSLLIVNAVSRTDFLNIDSIPWDVRQDKAFIKGTSLVQKIFLEFRQLVFSLPPLILFAMMWLWLRCIRRKNELEVLILSISSFFIVYYSAVINQGLLANIRYSIILYPLAYILGILGLYDLFSSFKKKLHPVWIFIVLIIFLVISILDIKPFYFNYTNSLLPNDKVITGAWGYGGYEAAQYLNNLPDAKNLSVWADYQGVCEFFKGHCVTKNYKYNPEKYSFDYFVLSRRGQILNDKKGATQRTVENEPVFNLIIQDRPGNFITIMKAIK